MLPFQDAVLDCQSWFHNANVNTRSTNPSWFSKDAVRIIYGGSANEKNCKVPCGKEIIKMGMFHSN